MGNWKRKLQYDLWPHAGVTLGHNVFNAYNHIIKAQVAGGSAEAESALLQDRE